MYGGEKSRTHHGVVSELFEIASAAVLHPHKEVTCFPRAPQLRMDVTVTWPHTRIMGIDFACINPLQPKFKSIAAASQGAAATAYEELKRAKYQTECDAVGMGFTPLVAECYGAWGASALPVLRHIACQWGKRRMLCPARSIPMVIQRISSRLQHGIAHALLVNDRPEPITSRDTGAQDTEQAAATGEGEF